MNQQKISIRCWLIGLYRISERAQQEIDFIIEASIASLSFLEYMNTLSIVRIVFIYFDKKNNQLK